MRLSEIIRLVWMNLIQNRTKVLLTSLGIIVGSATIVLVIAIGQGGQADVAEQFKNLNAGAIDIKSVEASAAQGPDKMCIRDSIISASRRKSLSAGPAST